VVGEGGVLLFLKLTLVPGLVVGVTLGARRWGARIGGWLTALPLVAGPTLFFLAVEQGRGFAAEAALSTLVGLVGVAAFGVVYGWTAVRCGWALSLLASWAAFVVTTILAQAVSWTPALALLATLTAFAVGARVLPRERGRVLPFAPPVWDLPLRMLGTLGSFRRCGASRCSAWSSPWRWCRSAPPPRSCWPSPSRRWCTGSSYGK
jgi:hypothetical protein